jgi:hypothetical protein
MSAQGLLIEELRADIVTLQANEQRVHEELDLLRGRLVELCGVVGACGGLSSPEEEGVGDDGDRGQLSPVSTTVVNDNRQLSPKQSRTGGGEGAIIIASLPRKTQQHRQRCVCVVICYLLATIINDKIKFLMYSRRSI